MEINDAPVKKGGRRDSDEYDQEVVASSTVIEHPHGFHFNQMYFLIIGLVVTHGFSYDFDWKLESMESTDPMSFYLYFALQFQQCHLES